MTYIIKSHTNNNKQYVVDFPHDSEPTCTCTGYSYRRTCSHIQEALLLYQHDLQEQISRLTKTAGHTHCIRCSAPLSGTHSMIGVCHKCIQHDTFNKQGATA